MRWICGAHRERAPGAPITGAVRLVEIGKACTPHEKERAALPLQTRCDSSSLLVTGTCFSPRAAQSARGFLCRGRGGRGRLADLLGQLPQAPDDRPVLHLVAPIAL